MTLGVGTLSMSVGNECRPNEMYHQANLKSAGINKEIHPHQLRHSYATHLLNNGAPIEVIQSLMGYEKSENTRIYT